MNHSLAIFLQRRRGVCSGSTRALGTLVSLLTLNALACGPELGTRPDSGGAGGEWAAAVIDGRRRRRRRRGRRRRRRHRRNPAVTSPDRAAATPAAPRTSGGTAWGRHGRRGGSRRGRRHRRSRRCGRGSTAAAPAQERGRADGPPDRRRAVGQPPVRACLRQHRRQPPQLCHARNEMKWDATEPIRNVFTFERGDAIVAFAAEHGMQVRGHTLVWHSQLPSWVSSIQDATDMRTAMINHITQVALHSAARSLPGTSSTRPWPTAVRRSAPPPSAVDRRALHRRRVHRRPRRRSGRAPLLQRLRRGRQERQGGLRLHHRPGNARARRADRRCRATDAHRSVHSSPSAADVAFNMQRLAALGLEVVISEMDVQICTSDLDAQSRRFHDIVARCVAQPACKAVTVWGVPDKYSWRNGQSCAAPRPLLFDDDYVAKPAYAGVVDAFLGI